MPSTNCSLTACPSRGSPSPETDGFSSPAGCITPRRPGCITAVITHGWDSVPDVQKVIADFTARAAMGAPGSIASQRAGTQYVAYATHNGEATGGGLLSTEKALLEKYKLRQVP